MPERPDQMKNGKTKTMVNNPGCGNEYSERCVWIDLPFQGVDLGVDHIPRVSPWAEISWAFSPKSERKIARKARSKSSVRGGNVAEK